MPPKWLWRSKVLLKGSRTDTHHVPSGGLFRRDRILRAGGTECILGGMTSAGKWELVPEEEYLRGELASDRKHEYIGGIVHAMAGASNRHNQAVSFEA